MATTKNPLETVRLEDYIEYHLFPVDCDAPLTPNENQATQIAWHLELVAQQVNEIAAEFCADYIWHKDGFRVTARSADAHLLREADDNRDQQATDASAELPAHLYGVTYFDDNIQDEWFVVALLFELTRRIPGLIARVTDADGEFVLIEAAEHLPGWANPETCAEKIFITAGQLHLVNTAATPNTPPPSAATSIATSLAELRRQPSRHQMSAAVQSCIAARIADYPHNLRANLHLANVYIPLPAAALLHAQPQLVAASVRAFCQRDPIDMRACRAMRHFPPETRVRTTVKFTRYLYAMLAHSNYTPDRRTGWNLPAAGSAQHSEHLLGVKLACGFEILAAQAKPAGAEDADLPANRQWLEYRAGLEKRGYFRGLLEGSQEHQRLLAAAREYFRTNVATGATFAAEAGEDIVRRLKSMEINEEEFRAREADLQAGDDEAWMSVSAEDLDAMLASRYGIKKSLAEAGRGGNGNALTAAAELTGNITEFLDRKSEWDGVQVAETSAKATTATGKTVQFGEGVAEAAKTVAELNDSLNNSTTIDFRPEDFGRHVQEMLDLVIPEDDWAESGSDMSDYENDAELEENIRRMANGKTMKAYMNDMDAELSLTTIGKSFEQAKKKESSSAASTAAGKMEQEPDLDSDDFDDVEDFKRVDIDANTLKYMAQSVRSQSGGPGPASIVLGTMGIRVKPSDEDDMDGIEEKLYNTQV